MKISIPGDTTDTEYVDVNPVSFVILKFLKWIYRA